MKMQATNLFEQYMEQYKANRLNPPPKISIPGTGFYLTKKHRLIVIGGMPGIGKTAYSLETVLSLADQGQIVIVMSYEMEPEAIIERMFCNANEVLCNDLDAYKLTDAQLETGLDRVRRLFDRIFIMAPQTCEDVHKQIKEVLGHPDTADTQVNPPVTIVWDYLQRMPVNRSIDDTKARIEANIRLIHEVNATYDAKSIVLTSLNRGGYHMTGMEAFKECGDIEYETDMAIIMRVAVKSENGWQAVGKDDLNTARKQKVMPVLLSMVKNRHGAEIEACMLFDKPHQKMLEMTREHEENLPVIERPTRATKKVVDIKKRGNL